MARIIYKILKALLNRVKLYYSINWYKTIYFNYRMLDFESALKLPVLFYGKVKFSGLAGKVTINAPIKFGMVGFGQKYEIMTVSKGNAELTLNGIFIINGHVQFGMDYFVYINTSAILEMGHLSSLGSNGKIVCFDKITFGNYARIGYESQLLDTSFHKMINLTTNIISPFTSPIYLGDFNYISNRVTILKSVKTPNNCTVASNSLLTTNYCDLGENIVIGGIPAKCIKNGIRRAWDEENIENVLII